MRETIHDSLRYLNNSDLNAMAVYLKQQPMPRSESSPKATISAQEALDGKQLYEDNCSSCHQSNGQGLAKQVPALAGNTAVTAAEPNDVIMAMLQGFGPNGTWGAMGSFAKQLTDAQIADIANYVRTAWNNTAEPNARAWTVGDLRDFADVPARSRQPDLICPLLPANVSQPALNVNAAELKSAASDRAQLKRVVQGYLDSRPDSTPAQTVEALSSAYCRAVVSEKISMAQSSAKIASFTQEIAIVLSQTPAGRSK
jgi:mono/diheme cytochrome c family protein